jgi:hypothetical protein
MRPRIFRARRNRQVDKVNPSFANVTFTNPGLLGRAVEAWAGGPDAADAALPESTYNASCVFPREQESEHAT